MTKKEALVFQYHQHAELARKELIKEGFSFIDVDLIWQILIYELDHYDVPTEVFFHEFNTNDIVEIIKTYFAQYGMPVCTLDLSIPSDSIGEDDLEKADIRNDGQKWRVHQNDADPFPSNPHAHNYSKHQKLHLGNGKLYRKTVVVGVMSKKNLKIIREKINQRLSTLILPVLEV
ncbi:MAG: hypothetical protein P0Y49_09265 [Candidatus Pedobacter colombiensis]|uniref:Uncharacterized protein n=1 Tax=Candidatus Pedobacter colombiensis TaxID=3121371 RepID=A0AAJ5WD83_9SPHI|nr:hypothetical protein [Pedobacter sp.]WEK21329.1 MAG: hypothetical protein P0Y49_09265 [Pedobacter sp.]